MDKSVVSTKFTICSLSERRDQVRAIKIQLEMEIPIGVGFKKKN